MSRPTPTPHLTEVAITVAGRRDEARRRRGPKAWLRTASVAMALTVGAFSPSAARAADVDDDQDGRFIGYPTGKQVGIEKSGTTLTVLGFLALATIGCIPLFKAAKRE
jgi:hypothetical protein